MSASTENTYWSNQGKYQEESERLEALIPASGKMTQGSPIEFFRIMGNMYYDLYNNGAGNTDVRGDEFHKMLLTLKQERLLSDTKDHSDALNTCIAFVSEYLDASLDGGEWVLSDDEEDEEWVEPDYPSSSMLYEPYELLVDAIIEMCMASEDPTKPLS